jgi:adenosylhomocysteine nucleosidase
MSKSPILVCFAVKEEAKFFSLQAQDGNVEKIITGMGKRNAAASIRQVLSKIKPALVITAGFAGGLNPQFTVGTVVFDDGVEISERERLVKFGAAPGKFYCAEKVAVTVAEKWGLWQSTGADAVEMESGVIRSICQEHKIPSAIIRVISDAAGEDLPLDFNALMTPADRINFGKLAMQIMKNPKKIPQLMRFQRQTAFAARRLGEALNQYVR